ncbi:hypothetical protein PQE72_gp120 [Bacillus phage vB_BanS_Skywalker]|uniref:Uncharacterized protein n=2 Tax=Caudoviricetes TaxID=2731619 RepID=A0AAE8YV82_9CAUD|nr:hypothetical protein PQE72_gp120 [Bacillus phage vB_BanS_Skywalker]UGO51323.1 hypothetical protein SKYWALKER_166 [Bacillus phage vB_BanS_Skywalker]
MIEFIQAIDWNSFWVGVVSTIILGGGGSFLLWAIGEGL